MSASPSWDGAEKSHDITMSAQGPARYRWEWIDWLSGLAVAFTLLFAGMLVYAVLMS